MSAVMEAERSRVVAYLRDQLCPQLRTARSEGDGRRVTDCWTAIDRLLDRLVELRGL